MGAMGDGDLILRAGGRTLALGGRPLLMGILNATPDSFSGDGARLATVNERIALARDRGVAAEQLVVDPGPDFAKTPEQTVAALRALPAQHALGRPILLAVSRKDFVGAITGRRPAERGAGTLGALAVGVEG